MWSRSFAKMSCDSGQFFVYQNTGWEKMFDSARGLKILKALSSCVCVGIGERMEAIYLVLANLSRDGCTRAHVRPIRYIFTKEPWIRCTRKGHPCILKINVREIKKHSCKLSWFNQCCVPSSGSSNNLKLLCLRGLGIIRKKQYV
jgi:hypothetical protein